MQCFSLKIILKHYENSCTVPEMVFDGTSIYESNKFFKSGSGLETQSF